MVLGRSKRVDRERNESASIAAALNGALVILAFIWNFIRAPYLFDKESSERLEPLNYDPLLAQRMLECFKRGQLLAERAPRTTGDHQHNFKVWCEEVTNLMRGRLPPAELLGFETISGGDLNLGLGEMTIRVNKFRQIILRYSEIAPGAVRRPAID